MRFPSGHPCIPSSPTVAPLAAEIPDCGNAVLHRGQSFEHVKTPTGTEPYRSHGETDITQPSGGCIPGSNPGGCITLQEKHR